jgi:phage terminase large subunit GpA-like protein
VFAIFGDRSQQKPLLGMASRRNRYRAAVFPLCVDSGRADIVSRLKIRPSEGSAPGFIHLPKGIEDEWLQQLASTRSVWKRSGGLLVREWTKAYHPRDHLFDLAVYGLAALRMLGPAYIQRLGTLAAKLSEPVEGGAEAVSPPAEVDDQEVPAPLIRLPQRGSSWVRKGRWPR